MIIHLNEIPDEGKVFILSSQTGELNEILEDLIGETPHKAELTLQPMQPGQFSLKGRIHTEVPDLCSRCGQDIDVQIDKSFNELMLPQLDQPADARYAKPNHFSELKEEVQEGEISVLEYRGNAFNLGEYLHEVVALAVPFNPVAPCDAKGNCLVCKENVNNKNFCYEDQAADFSEEKSPFSALKKLKT